MTRFTTFLSVFTLYSLAHAIPVPRATPAIDSLLLRGDSHLVTRQTEVPSFPSQYPSCVACEPEWSGISSCAAAAPAFEDFMNVIYNPLSFIAQIQCACTDTFSSAFPQCLDCFVKTNQSPSLLGVPSEEAGASTLLDNIRSVYGLSSAIFGGGVAASQSDAGLTYLQPATTLDSTATATSETDADETSSYEYTPEVTYTESYDGADETSSYVWTPEATPTPTTTTQVPAFSWTSSPTSTTTVTTSNASATTTSYGPGGVDVGSAEGASGDATAAVKTGATGRTIAALVFGLLIMWIM